MPDIHISDVRQFLSCRRAWDYASMLRQGYEPDPTPIHFLVGRAVHFAMYAFYEEGVHPAYSYKLFIDNHIKTREPELLIPDEKSKRQQAINVGLMMCDNYFKWVTGNDSPDEGWTTLSNETKFRLPLFNEEGKKSKRISLAGRFDRVAQKEDGSIWLWEFKTTAREPDHTWLELDNQVTTYCYAAEQILGVPIAGIHFRFMKKKFPEKPHRIRQGLALSRAINSGAQGVNSTYDLYVEAIEELAAEQLAPKFAPDPIPEIMLMRKVQALKEEYDDVLTQLADRGWEEYFKCFDVVKTKAQIKSATRNLWLLGLEMSRPNVKIYPAEEWQKCRFCSYREPCLMTNNGEDPSALLHHTYLHRDPNEPDLDTILSLGGEE
jgi:hypothetical protein